MAFDSVPIGIGDRLPEPHCSCRDRSRVSGCPSLENALVTVEMVLVPSDRKYFDSPACLATGRLSMVGLICPRNRGRYKGVHVAEFHYLEDLAADRVYEFCYIAATNKIKGSTAGFTMRPIALR